MLYTIGHSKHEFGVFLSLLKRYKIDHLLDVRSTPYSKFAEVYNEDSLIQLLPANGICYSPMGKYFGARQKDRRLYSGDGYLDFEKTRSSDLFLKGMASVERGLQQGRQIVLMCTEKDPIDCHRAILVAKAFYEKGIEVHHILADGTVQTHTELETRLLDEYYPNRNQVDLFAMEKGEDEKQLIQKAYAKRNAEIGYRYGSEEAI